MANGNLAIFGSQIINQPFFLFDFGKYFAEKEKMGTVFFAKDSVYKKVLEDRYGKDGIPYMNMNSIKSATPVSEGWDKRRCYDYWVQIEEQYGVNINKLMVWDRTLASGYSSLAPNRPTTHLGEKTRGVKAMATMAHSLDTLIKSLEKYHVAAILGGDTLVEGAAHYLRVPYRNVETSRYERLTYWKVDAKGTPKRPYDPNTRYPDSCRKIEVSSDPISRENYNRSLKTDTIWGMTNAQFTQLARVLYGRIRGYDKAKDRLLRRWMVFYVRRFLHLKNINTILREYNGDWHYKNGKIVLFPLHLEPEKSLLMHSPEFFDQRSVISQIAKSLPAGYILAVKDHYTAIGNRDGSFYRHLVRIPNVMVVNPYDEAVRWMNRAAFIVSFASSAGMEALRLGKRVILFSRNALFSKCKGVYMVNGWHEVETKINEIISDTTEKDQEIADDVNNFINYLHSISFDSLKYLQVKKRPSLFEEMYDHLLQTGIDL
jgi:hypothetical protein